MSDIEDDPKKQVGISVRNQRAVNQYARDEYDTKVREDKKNRMEYLLTQSEILTFMQSAKAPFFRTHLLLYQIGEYDNFIGQETYIHFVAQETRITRKLFIFNYVLIKKGYN